ncbi:hypothetical protein [Streptomyces sp. URMC 124]|uniref:hypothetical protein n=1 Tax=Streptomyces sp. URMC 124 TaxID=3423405 RepID=UPI003F1E3F53
MSEMTQVPTVNDWWPSEADVEAAQAAVRAQLIDNFVAALREGSVEERFSVLQDAARYDEVNPDSSPVVDELHAIHDNRAVLGRAV